MANRQDEDDNDDDTDILVIKLGIAMLPTGDVSDEKPVPNDSCSHIMSRTSK